MTAGERLIWAAWFVKVLDFNTNNTEILKDSKKWEEFESARMHQAAESATGIVNRLREQADSIEDGFGLNSPVTRMVHDMLGFYKPV
ncbi:MAG: hypothetical protein WC444_04765 [Candidatus Paceibacterota bacterium]